MTAALFVKSPLERIVICTAGLGLFEIDYLVPIRDQDPWLAPVHVHTSSLELELGRGHWDWDRGLEPGFI